MVTISLVRRDPTWARWTVSGLALCASCWITALGAPCQVAPDAQVSLETAQRLYADARFNLAAGAYASVARRIEAEPTERLVAMSGWERALKVQGCDDEAIAVQLDRLALAEVVGDLAARRSSWARLARLTLTRDSAEAKRLAQRTIDEAPDATAADDASSDASTTLAILALARGEYDAAQGWLSAALRSAVTALRRSEAWRTLGALRQGDTRFGDSREAYRRAIDLADAAGDAEARALAAISLAGTLGPDEADQAAALREQSRAAAQASNMQRVAALADALEAESLRGARRYSDRVRASELLERAAKLFSAIGDASQERAAQLELATSRYALGNLAGAYVAVERSGQLARELDYATEAAKAEHLLGLLDLEQEPPRLDQAQTHLAHALEKMRGSEGQTERVRILNDMAVVAVANQDYPSALQRLMAAQQLAADSQESDAPAVRQQLQVTLGWSFIGARQPDSAVAPLRAATTGLAPEPRGQAWWGLARLNAQREPELARLFYERAIADIEPLRPRGTEVPTTARTEFQRRYSSLYRELAALLLRLNQPAQAHYVAHLMQRMELVEASWGPARGDAILPAGLGRPAPPGACETALAQREGAYVALWSQVASAPSALQPCCAESSDASTCPELRGEAQRYCKLVQQLDTERRDLAREERDCMLALRSAAARTDIGDLERFDRDWTKAVGSGVTLVVTILESDQLHVMVRSPATAGYVVRHRAVGRPAVQELIARWRIAREDAAAQPDHPPDEAQRREQVKRLEALRHGLLNELYLLLFADLPPSILAPSAGAARPFLIIALDGPLRELPIPALFDGEHYLGERAAIALLTPTTISPRDGGAAPSAQSMVLGMSARASPPLPGVAIEIGDIGRILRVPVHLDEEASGGVLLGWLDRLKVLDARALVLHVAAHGEMGETSASTAIHLWRKDITGRELEDRSDELARVRLVVLSSCESAGHGQGNLALGLAGIVEQGSRSVVGSFWKVNDRVTAEFMTAFYTEWTRQNMASVSRALAVAQDRVRASHPHPYYWAAFAAIGRWD